MLKQLETIHVRRQRPNADALGFKVMVILWYR